MGRRNHTTPDQQVLFSARINLMTRELSGEGSGLNSNWNLGCPWRNQLQWACHSQVTNSSNKARQSLLLKSFGFKCISSLDSEISTTNHNFNIKGCTYNASVDTVQRTSRQINNKLQDEVGYKARCPLYEDISLRFSERLSTNCAVIQNEM